MRGKVAKQLRAMGRRPDLSETPTYKNIECRPVIKMIPVTQMDGTTIHTATVQERHITILDKCQRRLYKFWKKQYNRVVRGFAHG